MVELGITPLGWAALKGELDVVTRLLEGGADVNRANRDGSTPLHCAAFLGRQEVAAVLIAHGADANARNHTGEHPLQTTYADGRTTQFIVGLLGLPQPDGAALESGRGRVRDLLVSLSDPLPDPGAVPNGEPTPSTPTGALARYQSFVSGAFFRLRIGGRSFHLIGTGIFGHLWFLWFLCWIVTLFDASYWLYLAHLPLIIGGQAVVRAWPLAAIPKCLIVSCLTTLMLLIIYDRFVRYTWIGLVLNGRRRRDPSGISTASAT